MAANKTKPTTASVASFIGSLPDETKRADCKALAKLMEKVTGHKPKLWGPSIIGFGAVHYKYDSGREGDMPLAAFSPRKTALVIYGMNCFPAAAALAARLGKCKCVGSCLHVKKLAEIDVKLLEDMVAQSVASTRAKYPA